MALSQALSTGITGLMTHQKCMDNIGNNLANVNTTGFKKGIYQFSTLLEQSLRGGMGADATSGRGAINPIAMGMGAQTSSINKVFTQGNLENTGNPTDMAIDGNGFFVLKNGNGYVYTRAGAFHKGEDGTLLAPGGLQVQGTMAVRNSNGTYEIPQDAKLQNIVIPIGSIGGHSQTSQAAFTGNLNASQPVSNGLRLFGGTSYPTQGNRQSWLWQDDFNGGTGPTADTTWNSLESSTYSISQSTWDRFKTLPGNEDATLPRNVTLYDDGVVSDFVETTPAGGVQVKPTMYAYDAIDTATGQVVSVASGGQPVRVADLAPGLIPVIEDVKVINGGNVQTSAAYGIKVPDYERMNEPSVNNNFTYPSWFYQSTGAAMSYDEIAQLPNSAFDVGAADETLRSIWPNGINGEGWPSGAIDTQNLPYPGDVHAASLNTPPLENLWYDKGGTWVQPYAGIKNGDTIDISFTKGQSVVDTQFKYNRPSGTEPLPGQIPVDHEKSYTLEHFLNFLAGDVDEPSTASQNITPEMFGYGVDENWDDVGYRAALENTRLATQSRNQDDIGGAMGTMSIPPKISDAKFGSDAYDAPIESGGAYTRTGVSTVKYDRWDGSDETNRPVEAPSFNVSIVSNLGKSNGIQDISVSFNNVTHDTMFKGESEYSEPEGGDAVVSVEFFDSLGNPKSATMRLAMVDSNDDFTTWRWYADCAADSDATWQTDLNGDITTSLNVGTGLIRFDKDGNFVKGAELSETGGIYIDQRSQGVNDPIMVRLLNGLSSASTQDLDFSELTSSATANSFMLKSQNGRAPGKLDEFSVSANGTIIGHYDNGNNVPIARLGLAMFANENGLVATGNNLFTSGPASGDPLYTHADTGGTGQIVHMQLETSNVELTEEFTKLITTERGFQANSRTITTADEMITELLNLKR